eukprot:2362264-Rhodomonas_salina.1
MAGADEGYGACRPLPSPPTTSKQQTTSLRSVAYASARTAYPECSADMHMGWYQTAAPVIDEQPVYRMLGGGATSMLRRGGPTHICCTDRGNAATRRGAQQLAQVRLAICPRACYAMFVTGKVYAAIGLRACYAMSGTELAYDARFRRAWFGEEGY